MEITDIIVRPIPKEQWSARGRPLLATCSITFDHVFVVHEVKIVATDPPLVDMPSRKTVCRCSCGGRNPVQSRFCGRCGARINLQAPTDAQGRPVLHVSMAHPIDNTFRVYLEKLVMEKVTAILSGHTSTQEDTRCRSTPEPSN